MTGPKKYSYTHYLKTLAIDIVICGFIYGAFAFAAWETNPERWEPMARQMLAYLIVSITGIIFIIRYIDR